MKDDNYCSIETGLLLGECGYKENLKTHYKGYLIIIPQFIATPNLYDAQKWFRDKYNIIILIDGTFTEDSIAEYTFHIRCQAEKKYNSAEDPQGFIKLLNKYVPYCPTSDNFAAYEVALDMAIRAACEILKERFSKEETEDKANN